MATPACRPSVTARARVPAPAATALGDVVLDRRAPFLNIVRFERDLGVTRKPREIFGSELRAPRFQSVQDLSGFRRASTHSAGKQHFDRALRIVQEHRE